MKLLIASLSTYDHLINLYHFIMRWEHFPENEQISNIDIGGCYLMASVSWDMIISKKTGQLLLTKPIGTYKTLSVRITSGQIRHSDILAVYVKYILQFSARRLDGKSKCLKNGCHEILLSFSNQYLHSGC